jgi:hypothetical protein
MPNRAEFYYLCLSKTSKCLSGGELYFFPNSLLRCSCLSRQSLPRGVRESHLPFSSTGRSTPLSRTVPWLWETPLCAKPILTGEIVKTATSSAADTDCADRHRILCIVAHSEEAESGRKEPLTSRGKAGKKDPCKETISSSRVCSANGADSLRQLLQLQRELNQGAEAGTH